GWTISDAVVGFNTPSPGKFNGGVVTLNGIAAGDDAEYAVFGWTGSATSFDSAVGAFKGVSDMFHTSTGGAGVPPSTPVPLSITLGGMLLIDAIPEPSSFGLAGLGAAVLLILRRRRRGFGE